MKKKFLGSMIIFMFVFLFASLTFAHEHSGYSHDETTGDTNPNWMFQIKDDVRLNDLSIPGTHDTMSTGYGGDIVQTQSMSLETQLDAGIRFLDIRCRYTNGSFAIHHESVFLHTMFGDVLNKVTHFLRGNPSETVFMRIKQEHGDESNDTFNQTLKEYMNKYPGYFFDSENRTNTNPTLKEMRGKIVIFLNVGDSNIGLDYPHNFNIQDDYKLSDNWDLYDKWLKVKNQLNKANTDHQNGSKTKFINYLSGSRGSFPYFVASGHSSPGTSAPRLSTGLTTIGLLNSYPDFPRTDCLGKLCTIAFEGTNILTTDFIADNNLSYVGIVVSDFPGKGLINNIINVNKNLFKPNKVHDGVYQIVSAVNDTSVLHMDLKNNDNVVLSKNNNERNQNWKFEYNEQKRAYKIISKDNGLRLAWHSYNSGKNVFVTSGDYDDQYWIPEDVGDGYYILRNKMDFNKVLDVTDYGTLDGTNIQVWNYTGVSAQKFKLVRLNL